MQTFRVLALPIALIIAAAVVGTPQVVVNVPQSPAPIVTVDVQPSDVNVQNDAPVINFTPPALNIPAPVVNVDVQPSPSGPVSVIVKTPPAKVIYVEVGSCLNYTDLPEFDLANALAAGFPDADYTLNGPHYNNLQWRDNDPQPTMTDIIGRWLESLADDC
jgi:hypothetical protein